MTSDEAFAIADEVISLYKKYGSTDYIGEPVSQIEHMTQCAALAEAAGANEELILAAFFHDIGHFCEHLQPARNMAGFGVVNHEKMGADFLLQKGFSNNIAWLVLSHVASKRYLTYKYPEYYKKLSEASKKTLKFQGGRMVRDEATAFEKDKLFSQYIQLRYWDEQAKEQHIPLPPLQKFHTLIVQHLTQSVMKIQLAVFDMAGTTVIDDGKVNEAFKNAFAHAGVTVPQAEIDKVMGYHKAEAIRLMLEKYHTGEADIEDMIVPIHRRFTRSLLQSYQHEMLQPQPYAEELFAQLQEQGIRVALNTGFTREITDAILQNLGWDSNENIDAVICSDEVSAGRPHPHMIHTLMEQLSITNSAAVAKCGDTSVDVQEGRNAGCGLVVAITTGAFTKEELLPWQPDYIIDSLEAFPALLNHSHVQLSR